MNKNKNSKKINAISLLTNLSLLLLAMIVVEFVYLAFFNMPPEPEALTLPASNKKVLEQLERFNP